MTRNVLELPTLVLNRNWQPVHVTTVVRALVMLWNETAKAVEPDELPALRLGRLVGAGALGRPPVRAVGPPELPGPRGHLPRSLQPPARGGGDVQPAERGQAGPSHLPVLRGAARRRGDHDRPRHTPLAGGYVELDELRCRLRPLQCPQGRPHPGAGRHEAAAPANPPRVEAALRGAGRPGRELGPVPAARAGPAPRLMNNQAPPSGQGGAIFRGVLLGEQRASKPRGQGSNPCAPAPADVAER